MPGGNSLPPKLIEWRRIEEIRAADLVLSRAEANPDGDVEPKVVEEVFVGEGLLWHLHVNGQVIQTTAEHPFYVQDLGWVPCNRLKVGDRLATEDGRWLPVEDVLDTGEWVTLYNFRVAGHHTYFVGCDEWGFSVWAHNVCLFHGTRTPIPPGGLDLAAARANQRAGTPTPGIYFADSMRRAVPHAGPNGWVVRVDVPPLIAIIMARPIPTDPTITDYVADTPGLVAYLNTVMQVLPVSQAILTWGLN